MIRKKLPSLRLLPDVGTRVIFPRFHPTWFAPYEQTLFLRYDSGVPFHRFVHLGFHFSQLAKLVDIKRLLSPSLPNIHIALFYASLWQMSNMRFKQLKNAINDCAPLS